MNSLVQASSRTRAAALGGYQDVEVLVTGVHVSILIAPATLSSNVCHQYVNTYFPTTMPKSDIIKLQIFASRRNHVLICISLIKIKLY